MLHGIPALAKKAARRCGIPNPRQILQRALAVEIWRRAARMVMECIPRLSEDGEEVGVEDVDLGKSEPLDIDLGT